MSWTVIQHVAFEDPGLVIEVGRAHGLDLEIRHMHRGDPVPPADATEGLVVMGGPMGVYEADRHPHLHAVERLLAEAVDRKLPVLGICLGAQLLASALGARVAKGPSQEIGFGTVELTREGAADPLLGGFGPRLSVFHWHGDTFERPPNTDILASSDAYPHQAFRVREQVAYGLQFHVEPNARVWQEWLPSLPEGVTADERKRIALERTGAAILGRFFDLAATGRSEPGLAGSARSRFSRE